MFLYGFTKKTRRKITIGDESFFWMIQDNDDYISLTIQSDSGPGQKLVMPFGAAYELHEAGALTITPKNIRDIILEAKRRGWNPTENVRGEPFRLGQGDDLLVQLSMK